MTQTPHNPDTSWRNRHDAAGIAWLLTFEGNLIRHGSRLDYAGLTRSEAKPYGPPLPVGEHEGSVRRMLSVAYTVAGHLECSCWHRNLISQHGIAYHDKVCEVYGANSHDSGAAS